MTTTGQRIQAQRVRITQDNGQQIMQVTTADGELVEIELTDQQLLTLSAYAHAPLYGITCPNCGGSGESGKHPDGKGIPCIRCGGSGKA